MKPIADPVYVMGFLFDTARRHVVLIEKRRGPWWLHGKLNGIGGKIEAGESPFDAMCREGAEELGRSFYNWVPFACLLDAGGYTVHCFVGFCDDIHQRIALDARRAEEDEPVDVYQIRAVLELDGEPRHFPQVPDNLRWLIPMALHGRGFDDKVWFRDIRETTG